MTDTDSFNFSSLKIFDSVRGNLPSGAREICDVFEDLIFVWNVKDNNLFVVNWRSAQTKNAKDVNHQTLIPSSSPNFSVTKVSVSCGGTFVSISGQQGISLMEMPVRWGADGVYQDAKSRITCRTTNIHEHSSNHLEVIQTRWHPNSPTDSHLLVLLSDNSLRIYDEANLKHVWRVGPVPNYTAVEKNLSYLQSLGDTAVDFDIAPAKIRDDQRNIFNETIGGDLDGLNFTMNSMSINGKKENSKRIEWPIVILRGNGTIFIVTAGLNTDKPRLQGPLTMIPSQQDNYGDDSCSLLVIPTLPATIVIAENSGILHHALMIDTPPSDEASFDETRTVLPNDYDLYVLETIELELGLSEDEKNKDTIAAPVLLKRDPVNEQRYFCYHDTGLHGVTVGFIQQLQSYVNEDSETEPNMNVKSKVEYILSTKAFNTSNVNAVAGVGLLQSPSGIFAILSSGQVISLNTIKMYVSIAPEATTLQTTTRSNTDKKFSFDQHIRALLSSGVSQPILKLDKSKPPSSQQAFELLMNSIQVMRDNHFKRHDQVRQEIAKRVKILELMKNQQKDEIAQLLGDKENIQEKAYKLADKHEDIIERQITLQKRVQDVLRLASLRLPANASSEKEFTEQIKKIKAKADKLLQDVKQIKNKHEIQKKQVENWESPDDSVKVLPPKQEEAIKEILLDMTKQISNLQKDVQRINGVIDI